MSRTLVLGVGNLLQSDDGVGVHAVRRLEELALCPASVQIVDGGTMGIELLQCLEGVSHLVVVDAVEMGMPAGSMIRLTGDQVPAYLSLKVSPHQIGLPDLFCVAKLRDLYPQDVVIWGIQPSIVATGVDLSPAVAGQLDCLVHKVLDEVSRWEQPCRVSA